MKHIPYQWHGDLFCEQCIVAAMTEHEPWSDWLRDHTPGTRPTDYELLSLADMFDVDRTNQSEDFPFKLNHTPDPPSFCSECLQWFS